MSGVGQNPNTSLGALRPHPPGADMIRRVVLWSSPATRLRSTAPRRAPLRSASASLACSSEYRTVCRGDTCTRSDRKEVGRVLASQVRDRHDLPLFPQRPIGEAWYVAHMDARRIRRGRFAYVPQCRRYQQPDSSSALSARVDSPLPKGEVAALSAAKRGG
jgi:hypothetical protein